MAWNIKRVYISDRGWFVRSIGCNDMPGNGSMGQQMLEDD